jgi:hypothetical protein
VWRLKRKASRLFEIAYVLVRFDHIARRIAGVSTAS